MPTVERDDRLEGRMSQSEAPLINISDVESDLQALKGAFCGGKKQANN